MGWNLVQLCRSDGKEWDVRTGRIVRDGTNFRYVRVGLD
jgi:hypothetical protein